MRTNKSNPFLALTAIEEFWDIKSPLVFLGEWCKKYSRKEFWNRLNADTMPTWIQSKKETINAINYVNGIYEKLLPSIAKQLNNLHNENHNIRYWRILIGPWLIHHINIVYDRYMLIKKAIKLYPNFRTIGLNKDSYVISKDTENYLNLSNTDEYNLQIFSDILILLDRDFEKCQDHNLMNNNILVINQEMKKKFYLKQFIVKMLMALLNKISTIFNKKDFFIIINAYLPFSLINFLRLKTKGSVLYYKLNPKNIGIRNVIPDNNLRKKIILDSNGITEFENILYKLLPCYIPGSFVENYSKIKTDALNNFPDSPRALLISTLFYNETIKQWAARCAEKGTLLLGLQHGGVNCIFKKNQTEEHELIINDKYYTWGNVREKYRAKMKPMPAGKMINRLELGSINSLENILFVSTLFPRYLNRYWLGISSCYNYKHYIDLQSRFVEKLGDDKKRKLIIRPHMEDYGWEYTARWIEEYPNIKYNNKMPFLKDLSKCKILVCDHIQTVWLESLFINKPTIIYLDLEKYYFTKSTEIYFNELKSVSILHDSPEKAAEKINEVYLDVEKWWNNSKLQKVRKAFCNNYALKSPIPQHDWSNEIKSFYE